MAKLEEWQRDLIANVGDKLIADIVADNRSRPSTGGSMIPNKVTVVGAGRVIDGDDVKRGTTGWQPAPSIDNWKPPGLEAMDRMMDQQDAIDRAARARELAEAAAVIRALIEAEREAREEEHQEKKGG
jgi:hypothetical protein